MMCVYVWSNNYFVANNNILYSFPQFADQKAKFDGILGLAFPELSQNPGVNTVVQNLISQKVTFIV